jgi:hypothetical protein
MSEPTDAQLDRYLEVVAPEPRYEYRVVWQREGFYKRTRISQTLATAEKTVLYLKGLMEEATGRSGDEYECCDGRECNCQGIRLWELWDENAKKYPPLTLGPIIERRLVGDWASATYTHAKGEE